MRLAVVALALSGCVSLPWGSGGGQIVAPEREVAGGIIRQLGPEALSRASDRLALAMNDRWGPFELPAATPLGDLASVSWNGLALELGEVTLTVTPTGLEAELLVSSAAHAITVKRLGLEPCSVSLTLGPGAVTVALELAVDKLGRVQGSARADALFEGALDLASTCGFPDFDASESPGTEVDPLRAYLEAPLTEAISEALGPALASELTGALGADLALQWSAPFAADAIGTGFIRASVRGRAEDLVTFAPPHLSIAFGVGIEAEAHPCMAPLALPYPVADGPLLPPRRDGNDGALMVRLSVLEQALQAAWVAGAACADHASGPDAATLDPVIAGELVAAWPALARYEPDARMRLELWPEALPTLGASDDGNVRVTTGRVAIDVWIEDGAWWRAATVIVDVTLEGQLAASPEGLVWLDPTSVDVFPIGVVDGLLQAPESGALATILAPLVEQVVIARPLTRLPKSARPAQYETFEIGIDHAILLP